MPPALPRACSASFGRRRVVEALAAWADGWVGELTANTEPLTAARPWDRRHRSTHLVTARGRVRRKENAVLVREIMHPDPATVAPSETLHGAFAIMRRLEIRHLPVVEGGRVAGIVTDRDLRLATSALAEAPRLPEDFVAEVMSRPVQTAAPRDPVEHAARTMRELKIGCLPVVDGQELVGIVTGIDLLDTLLMMTGVHRPSARLELRLPDEPGRLAQVTGVLAERQINIHSILSHAERDGVIRLLLRVGAIDPRPLVEALCRTGVEVVWPPHHRCR